MYYIYCDGSSNGKSNSKYGWAYIITKRAKILCFGHGTGDSGTNNVAELQAAINGLKMAKKISPRGEFTLVSDSKYCLNMASGEYTPIKNIELCKELRMLFNKLNVKTQWVKGHSGNKFNTLADKMCVAARKAT